MLVVARVEVVGRECRLLDGQLLLRHGLFIGGDKRADVPIEDIDRFAPRPLDCLRRALGVVSHALGDSSLQVPPPLRHLFRVLSHGLDLVSVCQVLFVRRSETQLRLVESLGRRLRLAHLDPEFVAIGHVVLTA